MLKTQKYKCHANLYTYEKNIIMINAPQATSKQILKTLSVITSRIFHVTKRHKNKNKKRFPRGFNYK